jgi:hypothetical protein
MTATTLPDDENGDDEKEEEEGTPKKKAQKSIGHGKRKEITEEQLFFGFIVVDQFRGTRAAASASPSSPPLTYFLSHFHSDHYQGITKTWSRGLIHCSAITARLLHSCLGVADRWIVPL